MWFRIQDPLRNQVNLGEKCAAYGHSWSVRRNSVSDVIIGKTKDEAKNNQRDQNNSDNLVYGCSSREKSISDNSVLFTFKSFQTN